MRPRGTKCQTVLCCLSRAVQKARAKAARSRARQRDRKMCQAAKFAREE